MTKRVESLRAPCLDASSTLATSTFDGAKYPSKWIEDIDNLIDCQCLFLFYIPIILTAIAILYFTGRLFAERC